METKKLYRSQTDSVIAGVCGGLAEYFDIDPVLARVVFVLLILFGGGGFLVYVILWIVVPKKPLNYTSTGFTAERAADPVNPEGPGVENHAAPKDPVHMKHKGSIIGGIILLTLGMLFLIDEFIPELDFGRLWPVILIVLGAALIITTLNRNKNL